MRQERTSPFLFKDAAQKIEFVFYDQIPSKTVNLRIKGDPAFRVNIAALHLYGLYRNSLYESYREKPDLAQDIKERKNQYYESKESLLSKKPSYQSPLYHYSIFVSLDAMKEWRESKGKMKCYMAFQNDVSRKLKVGFVHFTEQVVSGKKVVYIAHAAVQNRGQGIGRHLMECVLAHYPVGTEFYILTRVFNSEAKNLYGKRLKFSPIEIDEIEQLGYDKRYCGFKRTTTESEVQEIINSQKQSVPHQTEDIAERTQKSFGY